jgi:hypothetical protein
LASNGTSFQNGEPNCFTLGLGVRQIHSLLEYDFNKSLTLGVIDEFSLLLFLAIVLPHFHNVL